MLSARCPSCFNHEWLKQKIIGLSKGTGQCECCGSENVSVVEASELGGLLDNLLSMYVVAESFESGELLISLIQWHWQVFDEDVFGEDAQADLLEEIANADWDDDDGEPQLDARELYQPLGGSLHYTHRARWEQFCSDVRDNHEEALPFEDYLAEDFSQLAVTLPMVQLFIVHGEDLLRANTANASHSVATKSEPLRAKNHTQGEPMWRGSGFCIARIRRRRQSPKFVPPSAITCRWSRPSEGWGMAGALAGWHAFRNMGPGKGTL